MVDQATLHPNSDRCDLPHFSLRNLLEDEGWIAPGFLGHPNNHLPRRSGLYLFLHVEMSVEPFFERVLYVGMAQNIATRAGSAFHPIVQMLRQEHIYYGVWARPHPIDSLRHLERATIRRFNPSYNIVGRRRGE